MQKYFQIGVIVGTHGVKGELKITPTTNDPERFKKLKKLYISKIKISSKSFDPLIMESKKIISVRNNKNLILVFIEGINSIEDAQKYVRSFLVVERKDAIELEKDEFFIADLIGCTVYDKKRGMLGDIVEIISTGSNDVYIVKSEKYGQVLIPVLKNVVGDIDIIKKKIDVDLLEGIIDD